MVQLSQTVCVLPRLLELGLEPTVRPILVLRGFSPFRLGSSCIALSLTPASMRVKRVASIKTNQVYAKFWFGLEKSDIFLISGKIVHVK